MIKKFVVLGLLVWFSGVGVVSADMFPDTALTRSYLVNAGSGTIEIETPEGFTLYYIDTTVQDYEQLGNDYAGNFSAWCNPEMGQTNSLVNLVISKDNPSFSRLLHDELFLRHHCEDDLIYYSNSYADVVLRIVYVPDSLDDPVPYAGTVSYGDWLFVSSIGLFLISFVTWGYFASVFKPKSSYSS